MFPEDLYSVSWKVSYYSPLKCHKKGGVLRSRKSCAKALYDMERNAIYLYLVLLESIFKIPLKNEARNVKLCHCKVSRFSPFKGNHVDPFPESFGKSLAKFPFIAQRIQSFVS
jgi:hypothetical protein